MRVADARRDGEGALVSRAVLAGCCHTVGQRPCEPSPPLSSCVTMSGRSNVLEGVRMARAKDIVKLVRDGMNDKTSAARLSEIMKALRRAEIQKGLTPEKLVNLLEDLGPTFIKLGQILSARSDMLPQNYCNALMALRSSTTPEPFSLVERRLRELYDGDWHDVFSSIEKTPLGSASIAQVYKATLKESGEAVAVKIRRDHVRQDMVRDIALMRRASDLLNLTGSTMVQGVDINVVIDELDRTVREEIDFSVECENLQRFGKGLSSEEGIACPKSYPQYSSETVLVMEFVDGLSLEHVEELRERGYDLREIGDRIANSFMRQMVEGGFYHADPHAANFIVRPAISHEERESGKSDPGEVVWIDCGMMGELSPYERRLFFSMMKAMISQDCHTLTNLFIEWGRVKDVPGKSFDYSALLQDLTALVNRYSSEDAYSMDVAQLLNDIMGILDHANVIMPQSFVMLVRGLASLQGTLISLSPEISILAVVERYVKSYLVRNFDIVDEAESKMMASMAAADKTLHLPERVSNVLDMTEKGRLRIKFEVEAPRPMEKIGHIIDRLSLAMIAAGLFVGSSLIYSTGMDPKLFGVPAIGFFGFMGALILSIYIVVKIRKDQ